MDRMELKYRRRLDVVIGGLAVVDVIGRPVNMQAPPKPGGLQYVDSITLTTGGNVLNCGIDLAKLGFRVGAIARVGHDAFGQYIVDRLRQHGVETAGITVDRRQQTASTMALVDGTGERTFLHARGCLRNFRPRDILDRLPVLKSARIFAFGYLGLLPECEPKLGDLFRTIKERTGVSIMLDTGGNPRRNVALLKEVLPWVDYFIPSLEEAISLTGEKAPARIVRALVRAGAAGVVGVKLGSRGCYIACDGMEVTIPAVKVRHVVDSTGAGDAFVSGFLAGTIRGFDPFAAAKIGNAVAASCVTAVGASTAIGPLETYLRRLR
jgi:sugar/nucleoside kinase (ribokinase family)